MIFYCVRAWSKAGDTAVNKTEILTFMEPPISTRKEMIHEVMINTKRKNEAGKGVGGK